MNTITVISFDKYMKNLNCCVQKYIPPQQDWTPADNAVFRPIDHYRVPVKEAQELQFKAIKYQFNHHFENNYIYRNFCKEKKVTVGDIKSFEDLEKIPLLPGNFFKVYPHGKEFATWLGNLFSVDLPQIKITGKNPTFDDVINAFNTAGMRVSYSSGTSGRHTFIPRDKKTFDIAEYLLAKAAVSMLYPLWDHKMYGYLLMPNPFKTNVFAGRGLEIFFDAVHDVKVAIDREINTEIIRQSMVNVQQGGLKAKLVASVLARTYKKMVNDIIKWFEYHEKHKDHKIALVGAPWILYMVMQKLDETGKTFDFAGRGGIGTGGGWKIYEHKRLSVTDFRKKVEEIFGIQPHHCLDIYGMVESNGWMTHCPEGHYLHIPHTHYHPLVLDEEFQPKGYGEYGRFAFLDGSTQSYPGFMISGDRVRLLDHCPVCDRPGPVLEPEVTRASGQEMRGCAEEMRKMMSVDIGT